MSESTKQQPPEKKSAEEQQAELDAKGAAYGLPPGSPEEMVEAAELTAEGSDLAAPGDESGDQAEATILNFLLGPTEPLEFDVDTWIDTPTGRQKLVFHIRQLADTRIEELEEECRIGEPPLSRIDRPRLNAAKVAEATVYIADADGRKVTLNSTEFRGPVPELGAALRGRFRFQPGILAMVAAEVDGVAGMREDRVGGARRASAEATITSTVGKS
jgi:hypothetical protein